MKRTTRKLFVAAAALGLAAASTIGSTYAWFTINGEATAKSLDMKVTTGAGISIKDRDVVGSKYTTEMSLETKTVDSDSEAILFNAVTPASAIAATNDYSSFVTNDVANTIKDKAWKTTDSSDFVALNFTVKVSEGYDIKLEVSASHSDDLDIDHCDALNVLRVAVVTYSNGSSEDGTVSSNVYRVKARETTTDYATQQYNAAYGLSLTTQDNSGSNTVIGTEAAGVTIVPKSTAQNAYNEEDVRIVVWYEGTDFECSNEIFAQSINLDFKFSPVKHA